MKQRIADDGFIEVCCPNCKQWYAEWFPHTCIPAQPIGDPRVANAQRFMDIYARRASDPTARFSGLRNIEGVYVVHKPNKPRLRKIGRSDNIENRIRTHNTLMKTWLVIDCIMITPDHLELERECHKLFAHKRRFGEWFYLTDRDLKTLISTFCLSITTLEQTR